MPWFFIEKIRAFTIWKIKILPLFLRWAHSKIPLRSGVIEKNPKLPCFGIYATTCFSEESTCKINSLTNSSCGLHIIIRPAHDQTWVSSPCCLPIYLIRIDRGPRPRQTPAFLGNPGPGFAGRKPGFSRGIKILINKAITRTFLG